MRPMKFRIFVLALLIAGAVGDVSADELTDRAAALVNQGKMAEAYALLEPLEADRAGGRDFDLLLGISAVDIGQSTRGVFALERVLAVDPNNARARAEIARAYLALGETSSAKQEFETVQKQGVPPEVSATIDRYLAAVTRLEGGRQTTFGGYLEAMLGYDTNVNVGPNKNAVAIPGFGNLPFTLSADSRANKDWFTSLGGGMTVRVPLTGGLAAVAGLSGAQRLNFSKEQFDNLNGDANAGVLYTIDKDVFSLTAQYNQYWLQSDRYRSAKGFTGQWQRSPNARNQFSAFVQYADLEYEGSQAVRNADRWVVGGAYAHAFRGGEVIYASAYYLNEQEQTGATPWLGLNGFGIRAGGQINLDARTTVFGSGSLEHRRYDAVDPSFLTVRKDVQWDFSVGATYIVSKDIKLVPKYSYTRNDSNAELNEYHREIFSVTLRRDF